MRILRLAKQLEGTRYAPRLRTLAREHDCCERTIRRYLHALEAAGWPMPAWRYDDLRDEWMQA